MKEMDAMTVQDAITALENVVERYGADTIYWYRDPGYAETDRCRYVDPQTNQAMCIVGVVLVEEWGVSPEVFGEGGVANTAATPLSIDFAQTFPLSSFVRQVLYTAQSVQDSGESWGEALAQAKEMAAMQMKFEVKK